MSKERFKCYYRAGIENILVEDTINNETYIEDNIVNLLNQQDKENQELKQQLEIFKKVNDALRQDNLDLSYDKVDMAYEYAKEMAENWENDYQEEIQQLKQSQKQLAIEELEKLREYIVLNDEYDDEIGCNIIKTFDLIEDLADKIKSLKGEE